MNQTNARVVGFSVCGKTVVVDPPMPFPGPLYLELPVTFDELVKSPTLSLNIASDCDPELLITVAR